MLERLLEEKQPDTVVITNGVFMYSRPLFRRYLQRLGGFALP